LYKGTGGSSFHSCLNSHIKKQVRSTNFIALQLLDAKDSI
jgi:hypothetical protein